MKKVLVYFLVATMLYGCNKSMSPTKAAMRGGMRCGSGQLR
jgi:hypothetical protein